MNRKKSKSKTVYRNKLPHGTSDLRIGLIGSGGRGAVLGAIVHRPDTGAKIVACCDSDPAVLKKNAREYGRGVFLTEEYHELLLRPLDAVIIATPDFCHENHAVDALAKGLAVYLEKPMAITIAGCDRILEQAAASGARLYVGHNMRHMPFVRKMKSLIDDGAIGEVKSCWTRHFVGHGGDFYFRDWHAEQKYSTGLLLQKAAHDIDVMHWLCGGFTRLVSAFGARTLYGTEPSHFSKFVAPGHADVKRLDTWPPAAQTRLNPAVDVEDLTQVMFRLDNGVLMQYAQCHFTPDYWRSYTVIGTDGRLENFGDGDPGTAIRVWNRRKRGYEPHGDRVLPILAESGTHGGADANTVAEFLRYVRSGGVTDTSPLAARESVATAVTATMSLRAGGVPMSVPNPAPRVLLHHGY